jgi:hypothetical protein
LNSRQRMWFSLLVNHPGQHWDPPSFLLNAYGVLPLRKMVRSWNNLPPPRPVVVKNDWSIVSTPGVGLRGVDRDKFLCYKFMKKLLQPRPYSFYLKLSKEGLWVQKQL